MPTLTYFLENRRLFSSTGGIYGPDGETRTLEFSATFDAERHRGGNRFTVRADGNDCDGSALECAVTITEGDSVITAPKPVIGETTGDNETRVKGDFGLGSITYVAAYEDDSSIHGARSVPAWIHIAIPASVTTFRNLLDADLERTRIYLSVRTELFGGGVEYGNDPDGSDVEWDAGEKSCVFFESISLAILPSPPKLLGDDDVDVDVPELPVPPPVLPATIDLSPLLTSVNRLYWVVLAIGAILLAKAFL